MRAKAKYSAAAKKAEAQNAALRAALGGVTKSVMHAQKQAMKSDDTAVFGN